MSEQIGLRDELIKLLDGEPFVPFQIVMSSGERHSVTRPHSVAVGSSSMVVLPNRGASSTLPFDQVCAMYVRRGDSRR
jgi:hypothetical protein